MNNRNTHCHKDSRCNSIKIKSKIITNVLSDYQNHQTISQNQSGTQGKSGIISTINMTKVAYCQHPIRHPESKSRGRKLQVWKMIELKFK